jgi:hypothetical protein
MLIPGADLFSVGSWNGLPFSESDIDGIVSSFNALGLAGRVPLKFTHDDDGSAAEKTLSKLALGWVKKIWREGDTLKGDLDVPEKVNNALKDGILKFVSVELLKDVRADTRKIPWVLDAVALLGSDQPAVGILNELKAVLHRRRADHVSTSFASCAQFKRDPKSGVTSTMDEKEERELRAQLAEQKAKNLELANGLAAEKTARETFEKNTLKTKADEVRAAVDKKFNEAIEQKRIQPFVRENFEKYQTPTKTDDRSWSEFDAKTVDKVIEANTLPGWKAPKGANMSRDQGGGGGRQEVGVFDMADEVDEGKSAGETFQARFDRIALENKVNLKDIKAYDGAMKIVMNRFPKLAQARLWEPEEQKKAMGGDR